jgi:hypothetical protein
MTKPRPIYYITHLFVAIVISVMLGVAPPLVHNARGSDVWLVMETDRCRNRPFPYNLTLYALRKSVCFESTWFPAELGWGAQFAGIWTNIWELKRQYMPNDPYGDAWWTSRNPLEKRAHPDVNRLIDEYSSHNVVLIGTVCSGWPLKAHSADWVARINPTGQVRIQVVGGALLDRNAANTLMPFRMPPAFRVLPLRIDPVLIIANIATVFTMLLLFTRLSRMLRHAILKSRSRCICCGYLTHSLRSNRCPECGECVSN